ncbi:MAG: hypothetical protein WA988_16610 [Candidatus Nanopelagicales bacterium]
MDTLTAIAQGRVIEAVHDVPRHSFVAEILARVLDAEFRVDAGVTMPKAKSQ